MNTYEFHIGDYYRRTKNLSQIEHYIYRSLLDECYLSETPLPADIRLIMREIGLTSDQKDDLEYILDRYFELDDDGYHHEHVEQVLARVYAKSEQAKEAADIRWDKYRRKANASKKNANGKRPHSDSKANGMPPSNPLTPLPSNPKKTATKRFVAPSLGQIKDYKQEKDLNIDPEAFIDFYESKGWMIGKNKMRDWKSAARGWSNRETKQSNGKLKLPRGDEQLESFAKQNDLPNPIAGESFWQYRNRLNAEIEKRHD